jgi:[protein-PII] uridylyltransferase
MLNLLEKIEADAAARLTLPEGTAPALELARFKAFLKREMHRLKMLHRAGGATGRAVCQARASVVDILIRYIWEGAKATLSVQARQEFPPLALVALGGYGRGELNPHSDLDIMFLHTGQVVASGTPLPYLSKLMNGILYPLWDLNFKVGHSVRTIAESVRMANTDMQSKTSFLEARLIAGDARLFEKFQKTVLSKCVQGREAAYLAARVRDQTARREKFGNSATMQEPNLKNGCGGLRDYQNLHWMAYVKHRTRTAAEMERQGLITAAERKQLEAAYDFLLRVRDELHYQANRSADVLTRSLQPRVALHLGYGDRSACARLERFMRDLYAHSRNIYLTSRTLEERLALVPPSTRLATLRQLISAPFRASSEQWVDGFQLVEGQIRAPNPRLFAEQPRRLLRVFLHAQQRGLRLQPELAQLIRQEIKRVDWGFLRDEHARETFLEILGQRGNVSPILRAMHEVGLLGKYLPEFGKMTCLVQHEFYHQYAADEHTLMCVQKLDELWGAATPALKKYAELLLSLERPVVLYLALLLHDVGKVAHTGKHALASRDIALRVARRLNLDGATTHSLQLLVEHHLVMAMVSQRRDLDDPAVIRNFANQIQTLENLRMLTLLTVADTLGTSNQLWTEFKDTLLWSLYTNTQQLLAGGAEFHRAEAKQRELLKEEVVRLLPRPLSEEEIEAHFSSLPPRYYQIHPARDVVVDLGLAHRFITMQLVEEDKALEPVTHWRHEPDRGYTAVKLCTWDRAGLFCKIAGSFAAAGVNILGAQAFTRSDGIVLDSFWVTDARTGGLCHREQREEVERLLREVLTGGTLDFPALIARLRPGRALYQSVEGERIPTRIAFDNEISPYRTVIDVEAEDRLGLLFFIAQIFAELRLDISLAKISTEKGAAIDSFYVTEHDGKPIVSPARQKLIEARLREALAGLAGKEARAGGGLMD